MDNKPVKQSSNTRKKIKKVILKQPDPTTEEIDAYGSDLTIQLVKPSISIDSSMDICITGSRDIRTICIDNFN